MANAAVVGTIIFSSFLLLRAVPLLEGDSLLMQGVVASAEVWVKAPVSVSSGSTAEEAPGNVSPGSTAGEVKLSLIEYVREYVTSLLQHDSMAYLQRGGSL